MAGATNVTKRKPLSRERIVLAGLDLAEDGGLEAVSLHKIADRLGFKTMSLYRHVADKDDLLDAMGDAVLAGMSVPDLEGLDWEEALIAMAAAFRGAVVTRPRSAPLLLTRRINTTASLPMVDAALGGIVATGLDPAEAVHVLRAFIAFMVGTLLREVGTAPTYAHEASAPAIVASSQYELEQSGFPAVAAAAADLALCDHEAEMRYGLAMLTSALRLTIGSE